MAHLSRPCAGNPVHIVVAVFVKGKVLLFRHDQEWFCLDLLTHDPTQPAVELLMRTHLPNYRVEGMCSDQDFVKDSLHTRWYIVYARKLGPNRLSGIDAIRTFTLEQALSLPLDPFTKAILINVQLKRVMKRT